MRDLPDGGTRAKARGRDEEIVGLERGVDRLSGRMEPAARGARAAAAAPGLGARDFFGPVEALENRIDSAEAGLHGPRSAEGRLAQLVRAPASHAGGRRFESVSVHHFNNQEVSDFKIASLSIQS